LNGEIHVTGVEDDYAVVHMNSDGSTDVIEGFETLTAAIRSAWRRARET
jgi:hypothetical protein